MEVVLTTLTAILKCTNNPAHLQGLINLALIEFGPLNQGQPHSIRCKQEAYYSPAILYRQIMIIYIIRWGKIIYKYTKPKMTEKTT